MPLYVRGPKCECQKKLIKEISLSEDTRTVMTELEKEDAITAIASMNTEAELAIKRSEKLARLELNQDYIDIIKVGYQREYSKEIAEAIATNTGGYDEDALIEELKAIKYLVPYLLGIVNAGDAGRTALEHNAHFLANMDNEDEVE